MIAIIERWTCDLCGDSADEVVRSQKPIGWVKIEIENPMEERSFLTKCICAHCRAALTKKGTE